MSAFSFSADNSQFDLINFPSLILYFVLACDRHRLRRPRTSRSVISYQPPTPVKKQSAPVELHPDVIKITEVLASPGPAPTEAAARLRTNSTFASICAFMEIFATGLGFLTPEQERTLETVVIGPTGDVPCVWTIQRIEKEIDLGSNEDSLLDQTIRRALWLLTFNRLIKCVPFSLKQQFIPSPLATNHFHHTARDHFPRY